MLWLLVVCLLIYLPFAMRSWRALICLCGVFLVVEIGVRFGIAHYSAADVPGFLVFAGNVWVDALVVFLPVTVLARALVLATRTFGLKGRLFLVANVIAILALPGGIYGFVVFERWERRPAPVQCTSKQIPLIMSGVSASAAWNRYTVLHVGETILEDARYLFSPRHRRRICRDTSGGTKSLPIEAIIYRTRDFLTARCNGEDITPWEQGVCENWKDDEWHRRPHKVALFRPGGIALGDFGIPGVPTGNDLRMRGNERLISVTSKAHGTVTAVCRETSNLDRSLFCRMRRPVTEGISLYWEAILPPVNIEEYLLRSDGFARGACAGLFGQPLCDIP